MVQRIQTHANMTAWVMEAKSFYSAINDGCGQLMMPTCTAMTTDDAYLYCDDN